MKTEKKNMYYALSSKLPHFSLFTFFIQIATIKLYYMYLNLLCRVTIKNSIQFNSISNSIQIQNQINSVDILKAYNVRTWNTLLSLCCSKSSREMNT